MGLMDIVTKKNLPECGLAQLFKWKIYEDYDEYYVQYVSFWYGKRDLLLLFFKYVWLLIGVEDGLWIKPKHVLIKLY